jgi:hypothetical protein
MGNIFSTNNNETIVLYPQNNFIYLLVAGDGSVNVPTVLEEDFRSHFSAFLYNRAIYYSYVNIEGEIVLKSTADKEFVRSLLALEDATLETTIHSLEQALESAKSQYVTLMDTATKYREEAQKWYRIANNKRQ